MSLIRIGYFEDFNSSNTLLLDGDAEGLVLLENVFRLLARGDVEKIAIHTFPFIQAQNQIQLHARRSTKDIGIFKEGVLFVWRRTDEGWVETADKIAAVQQSGDGHDYLDAESDQVTVMVSKGEYGDEFWARYG